MPRGITVADHLSLEELQDRYKKGSDLVESRRYHLIWLVKDGYSLHEAARIIGFTYDYAQKILKSYNQEGETALQNRLKRNGGSGRPPLLTPEQQAALQERLKTPPEGGGSWSGPRVAQWMSRQIGRQVSPQRGWDYLKRMGYPLERGGDRRSSKMRPAPSCKG